MKHSPQNVLLVDHRSDSVSLCYTAVNRLSAPLALSRELRCHPPKTALGCTLAGEPAANLRCALAAAGERIDWPSTAVIFGAPYDPFAGGLASLAGALKSIELLISRRPQRLIIQTRSSLILLATPLLQSFSASEVRFALEAADDSLHRRLLPSFLRPSERLETMETLQAVGVRLSIQVSPLITKRDSTTQLRRLVGILERSASKIRIYPIDSLLSARVDPALLPLHRARRNLLPQAHRLVRNMLVEAASAEQLLQQSA